MPKVSVVIPIYNTEKYLRKCLDSVRNQSMKDIEIICIDDGSTDSGPAVLDMLAEKDPRIKVVHKANEGLVAARKTGVELASGPYIGYVDSDDWIESDLYERLYDMAHRYRAELVTCGYYLEGNYTTEHLDMVDAGFYHGSRMEYLRDNMIYHMASRETGLRGGLWCKLFSADLLKKVQKQIPNAISIAEDKLCLLSYMLECSSVYVLKKPLYHWVIRSTSMSHESKGQYNDYLVKINSVYNYLITLYSHPNFTPAMRTQAEIYITELLFLGVNKRMGFQNKNMIWIDPYWMDRLPQNSKIVLYGGGELGEKYKKQLSHTRPDVELVACVDPQYRVLSNGYLKTDAPEILGKVIFDYIVITIKNRGKAENVKTELVHSGIPYNKIIWCEQPEAYWRFIEAEGLT